MKLIHVLLLAFLTCVSEVMNGQASLSLTTTSVSNSTPPLGTQISILTSLTNTSTTDTLNGIVNFSLANKDSIITNLSIVGYPNFAGTSITLAPQQSRAALFTVQIQPTYFAAGPDIIIVWPIVTNARVLDSAAAPINIMAAAGINDPALYKVSIFTFNDNLIVEDAAPVSGLEQLRIFDTFGNVVITCRLTKASTVVPINNLPGGIYLAVVTGETGQTKTLKFLK